MGHLEAWCCFLMMNTAVSHSSVVHDSGHDAGIRIDDVEDLAGPRCDETR